MKAKPRLSSPALPPGTLGTVPPPPRSAVSPSKGFAHPSLLTPLAPTSSSPEISKKQIPNAATWKEEPLHRIVRHLVTLKLKSCLKQLS